MPVALGIFVADVPTPGSDHRQDKPPTFREQNVIDIRIVRAHLLRHVRNVELDGSTAAGFEVDEQQAVTGAEEVPRMRFAVQQLVSGEETPRPTIVAAAPGCRHRCGEQRWIVPGSVVGRQGRLRPGRTGGELGGAFRHEGLPVLC